jgi:2-dehydro-3-deoxygalactonokinase
MTADLSGRLIAIDWGTSRLRARLLDGNARVLAETASDRGIGTLSGGHEAIFEETVAAWPAVPAIMAGMIGSRQGWREAPYVPCPATPAAIAAAIKPFTTASGRPVAIVPGLVLDAPARDGDVIRGEETQLIGLLEQEPAFAGIAVLPGTHSKWARVEGRAIVSFQSFMSGELFELLSRTSFLRHSVAAQATGDLSAAPDFTLAVRRVSEGLPFAASLFSVRTRYLLANAPPDANLAYLSGLVIGGEIAAARDLGLLTKGTPVRIVGATALAAGLVTLARHLGFIS